MIRIIIDNEQAKAIADSNDLVEVCNESGEVLGVMRRSSPSFDFTDEDIATAKRNLAAPGPRYTTAQALERIDSLENR